MCQINKNLKNIYVLQVSAACLASFPSFQCRITSLLSRSHFWGLWRQEVRCMCSNFHLPWKFGNVFQKLENTDTLFLPALMPFRVEISVVISTLSFSSLSWTAFMCLKSCLQFTLSFLVPLWLILPKSFALTEIHCPIYPQSCSSSSIYPTWA